MAFVWGHPLLTLIEVGWRWLFGLPFLLVCWAQAQSIVAAIPPESAGLDRLNFQNPWTSSVLLAEAFSRYEPAVAHVLAWLAPVGIVIWAIVSGAGRALMLRRMLDSQGRSSRSSLIRNLPAYMLMQGVWGGALLAFAWAWYRMVGWAAATHLVSSGEPDLVGYLCWLIFLSLGVFTLWAVVSWPLASAELLLARGTSLPAALRNGFRPGSRLAGKLIEVNLVMGIVKIALIVLAMVFSAAPLPFSDQFGPDFMHLLYGVVLVLFLLANDYFHVVRLRSFAELRRVAGESLAIATPTLPH